MPIRKFDLPHSRCNERVRAKQLRTFNDLSALLREHVTDTEARRAILAAAQAYAAAEYAVATIAPARFAHLELTEPSIERQ